MVKCIILIMTCIDDMTGVWTRTRRRDHWGEETEGAERVGGAGEKDERDRGDEEQKGEMNQWMFNTTLSCSSLKMMMVSIITCSRSSRPWWLLQRRPTVSRELDHQRLYYWTLSKYIFYPSVHLLLSIHSVMSVKTCCLVSGSSRNSWWQASGYILRVLSSTWARL